MENPAMVAPRGSEPVPEARIAIVAPAAPDATPGVLEALRQLGREAQLEVFHDLGSARAGLRGASIDLVVADEALGTDLLPLLDALVRAEGPPVLVVCPPDHEARALDAFRHGAADCVIAGPALSQTLAVAVLEQLRNARAEREHAQAAALGERVEDLERYTQNIVQNMYSALIVVNHNGTVSYANPMAERILRAAPGSLRGRRAADWFPDTVPDADPVARTVGRGERFRGAEVGVTRDDGQVIPVGLSSAPLLDRDGTRRSAVVIFQDLSEMKQLQRQVLQTEKMASIGQLAAGVAHEINNPMGFIHANLCQVSEYLTELGELWERVEALRKAAGRDPIDASAVAEARAALDAAMEELDADFLLSDIGKAIRESLEGSERIRHIVQDLRAFSHQDTSERALSDVNKALDSTANIVWTMMKHSVVLTKHYDELPPIPCHPMQLKQVFMNLLVNAYQAIEERPSARGEIRLRTRLLPDGVSVTVSDNGVGIPVEFQARIFDPFFTTKEVGEGTGLGLSTSFNLIQRHAGRLSVESQPGVGTTFEVFLPLDPREDDASDERDGPADEVDADGGA